MSNTLLLQTSNPREKLAFTAVRRKALALYENGSSVHEAHADTSSRCPADVHIPRWRAGPPAAWDFAVTSGMQLGVMADTVSDPDSVLTRYEDFKTSYRDTHT